MADLDYRDMLRRYLDLVGYAEGTFFQVYWDEYFSENEIAELEALTDEVPK